MTNANFVASIQIFNHFTKFIVAEMDAYEGMTYEEALDWAMKLVDTFDRTTLYDIEIQMGGVA
jgi:hypothetical protein